MRLSALGIPVSPGAFPVISICVGIKGREEQLLDCLISSMRACDHPEHLYLSVFDCGTPGVKYKIHRAWKRPFTFVRKEMKSFVRTLSLNGAADSAPTDHVFFTDADMILPQDFVEQFKANVAPGKVWFPVCFSLNERAPLVESNGNGYWRHTGYGMCGFYKKDFNAIGKWNQRYKKYGAEDNDIYDKCRKKFKVVREPCKGFFHSWHPVRKFGRENE